jgi:PAS domain S-box-containing protein
MDAEPQQVDILLVDDRPSNLLALGSILQDGGLNCVTAQTGAEALRHLLQGEFAVVLLDVQMPEMDGYQIAELMRERDRSRATPIIFITAESPSETHMARGYALGAVDYIFRPIQPEILRSKVAVFVELFKNREQIRQHARELDQRVHERTADLARANEALQAEIVERQRAEEQRALLLTREQAARADAEAAQVRYRNLFEGTAEAILVVDQQGHCLDTNPAAIALLGYTRDELLDMCLSDVLAETPEQSATELAQEVCSRYWRGEFEVRRKDGAHVAVEGQTSSVDLPTGTVYVATLRDISQRRAFQRMQEDFMAMVSHELQTPLTALKAYAQIMQRRGEYSDKAVDTIIAQAERLERFIGDLLAVTRLESGQHELQRSRVELVALARARAEEAQELTQQHTIRVNAPETPVSGCWDQDRLAQVLANLLSNAVKYSPGGGEIEVAVRPGEREVEVAVTDSGVGIPADALPHLFGRFYRVASTARTTKGLGLGLYITRLLVSAHGGRIWAESGPNGGTTFTFLLPYGQPEAACG